MTDLAQAVIENARLILLRALADERDYSMNETLLSAVLESFGHRRSRDWVRQQLRHLEEMGAVSLRAVGSVLIVTLRQAGKDHVDLRGEIEGVARPSPLA